MKKFLVILFAMVFVFGMVGVATAVPIPVANSTFNDPPGSGPSFFTPGAPASWDIIGNVGVFNPLLYFPPGDPNGTYLNHDGTDVALVYGGVLGQWLTESVADGKTYMLSVQAAGRIDAYVGATYTLAFVAGELGNLTNNIVLGTSGPFTPTKGEFATEQFTFTYTAANFDPIYSVLGINLLASGTSAPDQILFDNVSLDGTQTAVPEPTTLLLLGSGLLGLATFRKKFKK